MASATSSLLPAWACVRPDTVRSHIRQIYRKLEVNSRTEIIAKARAHL
ncbi:MAG: response regulator transcription factor [Hymenobacter sp.]|nr:MAG: response regulator transcription factor [Hymenobacter sp.]